MDTKLKQMKERLNQHFVDEMAFLLVSCQTLLADNTVDASLETRFHMLDSIVKIVLNQDSFKSLCGSIVEFTSCIGTHSIDANEENSSILLSAIDAARKALSEATGLRDAAVLPLVQILRDKVVAQKESARQTTWASVAPILLATDPFEPRMQRQIEGRMQQVDLTQKEARILRAFIESKNHCVGRMDLINEVWGRTKISEKTFSTHLAHLRSKLKVLGSGIALDSPGHYVLVDCHGQSALGNTPAQRGRKPR